MAGTQPGKSNGSATGSIHPVVHKLKPMSISLVRDYDICGLAAMIKSLSHCSFVAQMETLSKNLESFKRSNVSGAYPDEKEGEEEDGEVDEDDDVDDVDDDEDDEKEDEEDKNGEEEVLKNSKSFKRSNVSGAYPDKEEGEEDGEVDEDDNVDDVDDDEDDEKEDEEDKNGEEEEVLKLQVPNENERERKKPRLEEGFGCQAEAAD